MLLVGKTLSPWRKNIIYIRFLLEVTEEIISKAYTGIIVDQLKISEECVRHIPSEYKIFDMTILYKYIKSRD